MRLNNFTPSERFKSFGLNIGQMRDLKQIVALFGKNGSGKSRFLDNLPTDIMESIRKIPQLKSQIRRMEMSLTRSGDKEEQAHFDSLKTELNRIEADIHTESSDDNIIIINPRSISIDTNLSMQDSDYRKNAIELTTNPSYENVKKNCAKLIKSFMKSEISKEYLTHVPAKKQFLKHDEIQEKNINLLTLLKKVIKEIMNIDFDYTIDEHLTPIITINNRPLNIKELSPGEMELLAFCVFMALQSQEQIPNKSLSLKDKLIIIDEPDLFLHPKGQIDLINGLKNLVGNGQIWIATHSLSILSILDRDEVWLMEDGSITSPSIETPNKVLNSLIGEENIDRLEDFISSQYEWAAIQFALECLFPSPPIDSKGSDPQPYQIINVLNNLSDKIKILDYGAGKGRIARELIKNKKIAQNIYYQALEPIIEYRDTLEGLVKELQNLSNVENNVDREVIDNSFKLEESQYIEYFDIILLINVLHEIPITKWERELNIILASLKQSGKIMILEDQSIPRGENSNEYGFIIFDIDEFKLLFSLKNLPKSHKHSDPRYSDRLTCIEIPKNEAFVDNNSIISALLRKKTNCITSIRKLRNKTKKQPRDGRKNSFLTQLYTNSDIAYQDLKK